MMKTAIFLVSNGFDINKLKSIILQNPDRIIFTLDYESHKLLEKNKIVHELGEDILNQNDLSFIDNVTITTTNNFLKNYKSDFSVNDIFLPDLIEHELYQYFLIEFLKPFIIFNIIKNHKIKKIYNFTKYSSYIKNISKQFNFILENYPVNDESQLYHDKIKFTIHIGKIPLHITISRQHFIKLKKLLHNLLTIVFNLRPNKSKKNNILLVNFDPNMYSDLLLELNSQNSNFLLLNTRKPAITDTKSLEVVRSSNSHIIDLNEFYKINKKKIISEQIRIKNNLSKIFSSMYEIENVFSINNISFFPDMKDSFFKICIQRFNESIERIIELDDAFNEYDVSLILVWVDVGQEEKEAIILGKKYSISSIMLQHGRFQTSKIWNKFAKFLGQFPQPLLSEKQIVWGQITKDYAINYNHISDNLIIGGSPRHDKFFNYKEKKTEYGIIILATTGTMYLSADSSTSNSQIKYDDYIREVCRIIKSMPQKKLLIKPHPSQMLRKYTQDIIDEIDPSITVIENQDNTKLFKNCDLLITFNNSTTTLEAISLGTPVISLQTETWASEDDIALSDGIVSITDINQCENAIKRILFDEKFKNKLIDSGYKFLNEYMHHRGTASKNIATWLNKHV